MLARTHATLERVGAGLERQGVVVQYLGDLFARAEVRDLLALLSIDAEPGAAGLVRVAALPAYGVPREEALAVVRWAASHGRTVGETLARIGQVPGVGPTGAAALKRLGRDLAAAGPNATAWTVLATWLFETHGAADLAADEPGRSPMRRVAVYQLLRLAAEEGGGRRAFLARVRRIAALGGGRDQGVVAPEAESDDAVRLMTIHGAKWLEFGAVHLPMASSQHVPMSYRVSPHPPPPDLARLAMGRGTTRRRRHACGSWR